eukprot:9495947-Pyramimonas_sp.AAC.2
MGSSVTPASPPPRPSLLNVVSMGPWVPVPRGASMVCTCVHVCACVCVCLDSPPSGPPAEPRQPRAPAAPRAPAGAQQNEEE